MRSEEGRISLSPPQITEEDLAAVTETLRSGWLVNGPRVVAFEQALAERCGVAHAVAVSSGTTALVLALQLTGVGPGDRVAVPAFTYPATAHAVASLGAEPALVDVDAESWNIDVAAAARLIDGAAAGERPLRALLPVDQFGLPADLEGLRAAIARRPAGTPPPLLIDDAACALGATRDGRPCVSDAPLACLSFHPRKVITTGEGGALLLGQDDGLAAQARRLRNHGRDPEGRFVDVGVNHRMSELAAALGASQLDRLDALLDRRRELAARYRALLDGHPALTLQRVAPGLTHTYQTFAVCLSRSYPRAPVLAGLQRQGVEATIGTYGLHRQPPYAATAEAGAFPVAERLAERCIALPLHPQMSLANVERVCRALERALTATAADRGEEGARSAG